ncbi:universal stress protein [Halalkalicoccus jeotgali]|uniref:UspA domain protein n=1 Tax=Halalkalicoccus jeotgali (strain DSM 18796 / CECT 7217 / JCM 14584 / KCTC 4019 / B3) TaxID=795797 RepID=D8J953_HALJB|nr:universal stress protein [Halalkalicoccus jeotgali]ADJ16322.1 UspA domain protein [Halalkalicoccus jeotgali B3]ELY37057.1 UspA domain-containing protein [Halalkalicoccus jeotgali B3]
MAERILVPIDDSDRSTEAVEFAFDEHPEAAFVALHVHEPVYGEGFAWREREDATEDDDVEALFERLEGIAEKHGVSIETVTSEGKPSDEIIEYVESNPIDAIVMGSHGRSGASRVLLGSVAETVTRRSPVPVTVVR